MIHARPLVYLFFLSQLIYTTSVTAATPSDVHFAARAAIAELEAAKRHSHSDAKARVPGIQVGKTPLHVYSKSLELLEKVQRYQKEQGQSITPLPELPNGRVTPTDVLSVVNQSVQALKQINQAQGVKSGFSEQRQLAMTPSDVYEQVWQASYLIDALVPPLKPANVLRNANMIEQGLNDLARFQGYTFKPVTQADGTGKTPTDVNIEAYRALYKLAKLQRQLGINPSPVAAFPSGKVLPEDVFDTTGNILAELIRINNQVGNKALIKRQQVPQGAITPQQVYQQMHKINQLISQLIQSA